MQWAQAARHVLVGLLLASSGYESIRDGHHATWLDWVAIVSGLVLLVAFVIEVRRARARRTRHALAYGLIALLLLAKGLFHGRLQRIRRLVVDERGFDLRTSPWSRTRLAWSDVADVRAAGQVVTVATTAGAETRIDLRGTTHGEVVIETLLRHARAALAPTSPPPGSPIPDADPAPDDPIVSPS